MGYSSEYPIFFSLMKPYLPLLLAFATLASSARVDDPRLRIISAHSHSRASRAEISFYPVVVQLCDGVTRSDIESSGAIVWAQREDMAVCSLPADRLDALLDAGLFLRVESARPAGQNLDVARDFSHASSVLTPEPSRAAYTGAGVIVGFSDTGFDPHHSAFEGRVRSIAHFSETTGEAFYALTPEEIAAWTTDDAEAYHGTHVAGILCGNPHATRWRGIAPGADIVATTSRVTDAGVLAGVEHILAHAAAAGRRAVINISIGSTTGPRDGSTLFCRYLDLCAQDTPIVLSAGNDGYIPMHFPADFAQPQAIASTVVAPQFADDYMKVANYIDAWSADGSPFALRFRVYDQNTTEFVYTGDWLSPEPDGDIIEIPFDESPGLAACFTGSIVMAAETAPANARFHTEVLCDFGCTEKSNLGPWARYYLVMDVSAEPGTHVDCFSSGGSFRNVGIRDVRPGDSDLSISDMACGHNTFSVGSLNSRVEIPLLDGSTAVWTYMGAQDAVSDFSSYGVLPDGRRMPELYAPGGAVISAVSSHYLKNKPEALASVSYRDGSDYYMAECGTSMSSPHVAGIFATWLEADPTLTVAELHDIASQVSTTAGCIDALAGLDLVLRRAGTISAQQGQPQVFRQGHTLRVIYTAHHDVRIYDLLGRRVLPASLPSTPVIVHIDTPHGTYTYKL